MSFPALTGSMHCPHLKAARRTADSPGGDFSGVDAGSVTVHADPRVLFQPGSSRAMRSAGFFLIAVLVPTLAFGAGARSEKIYHFDDRANTLLEVFFPRRLKPTLILRSYLWPRDPPAIPDLDAVMLLSQHCELPSFVKPMELEIPADHLESYWLSLTKRNGRAETLLRLLQERKTEKVMRTLTDSDPKFRSVLEKALFQRDLFQIYGILETSVQLCEQPALRDYGQALLREVVRLWPKTNLSSAEFEALRGAVPTRVERQHFSAEHDFDLERDYLPDRVLGPEQGWYPLPLYQEQMQHFLVYQGRSFFHIFMKTPGWNESEFQAYWRRADEALGEKMSLTGKVDPLPAGTETLLVRTFGVFLADGAYADSGFPEEVLLRIFKYDAPRLDKSTSDYRGTLAYQYKMERGALQADVSSLGLRRIRDDSPSFLGFFTEVPDSSHTQFGDPLSTMRFNCILCHSTVRYGAGTVFSLSEWPNPKPPSYQERQWLVPTANERFFTLETPQARSLRRAVSALDSRVAPQ